MLVGNKVDKVSSFRKFTIRCSPDIFPWILQSCQDCHLSSHLYTYISGYLCWMPMLDSFKIKVFTLNFLPSGEILRKLRHRENNIGYI